MSHGKDFLFGLIQQGLKSTDKDSDVREEPVLNGLALTGHNRGILGVSGISKPFYIKKSWGSERVYQNNELYCAKLLTIKPEQKTSMHFHIDKHETMINVGEGILYIDFVSDKKLKTIGLNQWESFVIAPGLPHRLRASKKEVKLIESSTTSHDDDSIRLPEDK